MSNSKNDDQSAAIKSTSKCCLDNLRKWMWRNTGVTLVLKQTSASGGYCPGVMAITSILQKYADLSSGTVTTLTMYRGSPRPRCLLI